MYRITLLSFFISLPTIVLSTPFLAHAHYTVCFTPTEDCTQKIVTTINQTKHSLYIQAYGFTSIPIRQAVLDAKKRGVKVAIILDKSHIYRSESKDNFLAASIPVWVDNKPAIAHNKLMIIDQNIVITGSFNFTKAAQKSNAENVLIIYDKQLAQNYLVNWYRRQMVSTRVLPNVDHTVLFVKNNSRLSYKSYR